MPSVLVAVAIGVAVLGALVLLLFPDRPGGKLAWQGVEVSSVGAGLPLIALGVVAIALGGAGVGNGDSGGKAAAGNRVEADVAGASDRSGEGCEQVFDCSTPSATPWTTSAVQPSGATDVLQTYDTLGIDVAGERYMLGVGGSDIRFTLSRG